MRRSVWIFFASILLPSLGLAWLAIRSVQDQQVVLEHQQVIINQNITDALAKNVQAQMDQVRDDFVKATGQLLNESGSPQNLAEDFNKKLREAWPMAELGFAVNLNGEIYSPELYDGPTAKTFRDENDRFLSNRENVEVYSSNAATMNQSVSLSKAVVSGFAANLPAPAAGAATVTATDSSPAQLNYRMADKPKTSDSNLTKDESQEAGLNEKQIAPAPPAETDQVSEAQAKVHSIFAINAQKKNLDVGEAEPSVFASKSATAGHAARAESTPASGNDSGAASSPTLAPMQAERSQAAPVSADAAPSGSTVNAPSSVTAGGATNDVLQAPIQKMARNVIPQQMRSQQMESLSNTVPEESDFRRAIGSETSGELARFLENKMRLMVWSHAEPNALIVFGAQLDQAKLVEALKAAFQIPELAQDSFSRSSANEICVAILDDSGHPVALSQPGFAGDWKHPFVATEIGEVLPHWEAALYLVDPQQISRSARTLQFTLGLIVLLLVAAIISGGSLIAADVRRQVRLAQQKTDFVSNVSHELKTPLTSIRMFADLLAEKRVPDEERQATYLRIIAAEASRLTRLINNVLDFARLERGAPPGEHHDCDLVDAVSDVVETCRPHLEAAGISFRDEIEAETLPIRGDRDALAQIILNLISNAEKYGGQDVVVRVRRQETSSAALGCVDVLDRGQGIPAKDVRTIFEPFHRLDDSLSNGVPGSGLGLTLARRMARAHGGDVTYSPRAGGGSCFTLTIPLRRQA